MLLDPWTLWLVVLIVGLLLAGSMLFVWFLTPEESALGYWSAFTGLLVAGVSAGMARGLIPDFVSIELGNAAILLAYGSIWSGLRRFDRRRPRLFYAVLVALAWIALCQLPPFRESVGSRVVLISALIGLLATLGLVQTWRGWTTPSRPRLAVFVVLLLVLVLNLARIPLMPTQVKQNQLVTFTEPHNAVVGLVAIGVAIFLNYALVLMVRERAELLHRSAARRDELTGLLNRRGFSELALANCEMAGPLALIIFDVDHFKQVNDRFGHATGDRVLEAFAHVLRINLRQADIVGRIGGDEFAALLPGAIETAAAQAAERIRQAFQAGVGQMRPDGARVECSSSIGVACGDFPAATSDGAARLETLLAWADRALYEAKSAGRNRVVVTQAS
ncbi:MAG: diguanylate cyclase [Xanthobacteraceae bacterium]|jgi:diguanylate cyclase (GGDEF)-like protein|nr:diguanylate cyclase [Xanthobacteraceae bacterium]